MIEIVIGQNQSCGHVDNSGAFWLFSIIHIVSACSRKLNVVRITTIVRFPRGNLHDPDYRHFPATSPDSAGAGASTIFFITSSAWACDNVYDNDEVFMTTLCPSPHTHTLPHQSPFHDRPPVHSPTLQRNPSFLYPTSFAVHRGLSETPAVPR
ncbi:hypothetical protein K435DRAFT_878547 [Dendrothele bispora CBS 962.96]|uniref:Uncharacterized protein n=1 Tax=Dendrothele bispora (strain CBS 962.96) TaxID=1314807 RepID=A0A4V4HAU2_DENBC|nr:hypothetical protein K435DRAFT_878547 [Dendrothele bispora CBS 962.96]